MPGQSISQIPLTATSVNAAADLLIISQATGNPSAPYVTKKVAPQLIANTFQTNLTASIIYEMNGGGGPLATVVQGYITVPFNATITGAEMLATNSGSLQMDIWRCTFAQFDAGMTHPVSSDSICNGVLPTISSDVKTSTNVSGWNKTLSQNDVLAFVVVSDTNIGNATITLTLSRNF